MKLLEDGVLVKIPKFDVATSEGTFTVDFSVVFKRLGNKAKKARDKDLQNNLQMLSELQELLAVDADDRDQDAILKLQNKIAKNEEKYDKYLYEDVIGWKGLKDTDGSDVPFNKANKDQILDSDPFRMAFLQVWRASAGGVTKEALREADAKNS